jgi:hypothetical protein
MRLLPAPTATAPLDLALVHTKERAKERKESIGKTKDFLFK